MIQEIDDSRADVYLSDFADCTTEVGSETSEVVTLVEHCEDYPTDLIAGQPLVPSHYSPANRSFHCPQSDRSTTPSDNILTPTSSMSALQDPLDQLLDINPPSPYFDMSQSEIVKMPAGFSMNQRPPFLDPMEDIGVQQYDVLKIKNVPFAVSIPEIRSFVAHLTKSPLIRDHIMGYAVHIIMERPTGKTLDAFVEFQHQGAAQIALQHAEQNINEGRGLKIGTRHVEIELSSEGDLCAALFPRAKSVQWDTNTGVPAVISNQDPYSDGFQGFFTVEEITSVCRHASTPHKSTFSQRCQQRVYESMISTLYKFPWNVPLHYSVNARNFMWSSYMEMLHVLMAKVLPNNNQSLYGESSREVGLNRTLLMDFLFAGLNVPMFSLRQKFMIVHASGELGPGFDVPPQASGWPFQALVLAKPCEPQAVDAWIKILNIGFQTMEQEGIRHGYEQYLSINHDEYGSMRIELKDAGRALTFHKLISIEKGLMEFMVEKARIEWYKKWGIPFKPLCLWGGPSHAVTEPDLEGYMQSLSLSRSVSERSLAKRSFSTSDMGSPIAHSANDGGQSGGNCHPILRTIAIEAHEDDAASSILSAAQSQFDPATPSFVPTQLRSVFGYNAAQSDEAARNTPLQLGSSRPESPFLVYPISRMGNVNELSASRRSSIDQTPPLALAHQHVSGGTQSMPDYFSRHTSARGHHAPTLPSYHPSNHRQSDVFEPFGNPCDMAGMIPPNDRGSGDVQRRQTSVTAPQLVYSSIWGPPIPDSSPAHKNVNVTPTRRSVSSEMGSANTSPLRSIRSKSMSSPFSSGTTASPSPYDNVPPVQPVYGSSPNFQGRLSRTTNNEPPIWAPTNEISVSKRYTKPASSRSSAGRNAFQPQATIDEENDMSTVEIADGGVRLHDEA